MGTYPISPFKVSNLLFKYQNNHGTFLKFYEFYLYTSKLSHQQVYNNFLTTIKKLCELTTCTHELKILVQKTRFKKILTYKYKFYKYAIISLTHNEFLTLNNFIPCKIIKGR